MIPAMIVDVAIVLLLVLGIVAIAQWRGRRAEALWIRERLPWSEQKSRQEVRREVRVGEKALRRAHRAAERDRRRHP